MSIAFLVKEELAQYGLTSFVKTRSGKRLRGVVAIVQRYEWGWASIFAKMFSEYMELKYPKDYMSMMKKRYVRKKFILVI